VDASRRLAISPPASLAGGIAGVGDVVENDLQSIDVAARP
jgi:hypothetical protein